MDSKRKELCKLLAWRHAMHLIRSVAVIALTAVCLLAITKIGRTHTRITPETRAEAHTALFGAVSREAKSRGNLGGQMPPSFDQDVERVVAEIGQIEADNLNQMDRTNLYTQGQVHTLG